MHGTMLQYIVRVVGPVHGQLLDADVQVLVCWMVPHEPHPSLQVPMLAHSLHVPPTKQQFFVVVGTIVVGTVVVGTVVVGTVVVGTVVVGVVVVIVVEVHR
jgi:hypothetical protein